MAKSGLNRDELKGLVKEALVEVLSENREIFQDIFTEMLEDFVDHQISREGERPRGFRRGDVFPVVEGKA